MCRTMANSRQHALIFILIAAALPRCGALISAGARAGAKGASTLRLHSIRPDPALGGLPRRSDDGLGDRGHVDAYLGANGSDAWLENLLSIPQSRVLRRVSGHLAATFGVACAFAAAFAYERSGQAPAPIAEFIRALEIPALPHEAVGSFIALVLAFRTQQSYDRFWEGRILWDGIFGETRGIVRLLSCTEPDSKVLTEGDIYAIMALVAAYPYALKQHLRGDKDLSELIEAAALATAPPSRPTGRQNEVVDVLRAASKRSNVPLAIIRTITEWLMPMRKQGGGELLWWQLDSHIVGLTSILSKMERIKGTPVPLSYSRHTSRFFSMYTASLPMALAGFENLLLLPPTVAIVSWVLFTTEEIGHVIEEPFGAGLGMRGPDEDTYQLEVLPLGRYCAEIAGDVATFTPSPRTLEAMPGADEDVVLFDDR